MNRTDEVMKRFKQWERFIENGLKTPPEIHMDKTRSDCHAWSSHPLFHLMASIAGVRPARPGFREVQIKPQPAGLSRIDTEVPHPKGMIELQLNVKAGEQMIRLPEGLSGSFTWNGKDYTLRPGKNRISVPAEINGTSVGAT